MKISSVALFLASVVGTANAARSMRASPAMLKSARKLEEGENQGDDQAQEEEEYSFLGSYQLKMLSCESGVKYQNPENGEYESSSIIFRLCPDSGDCSDESSGGCSSGYGDYVIGINTFVQNYLEDKMEDMQQDDNFDFEEFGECREYEADQDAEDEDGNQNNNVYYVGPACSDDGSDIVLDMFTDMYCMSKSEDVTFYDISNGLSLPYSSGGLVSKYCESCAGYNDNGEYELSEMCMQLYENSGKCEANMESYHYMGQQTGSCEMISSLMPAKKSNVGKAVGWTFFVLILLGAAAGGFMFFQKKQSGSDGEGKNFGLMS